METGVPTLLDYQTPGCYLEHNQSEIFSQHKFKYLLILLCDYNHWLEVASRGFSFFELTLNSM